MTDIIDDTTARAGVQGEFQTFNDAYLAHLTETIERPTFRNAPRGFPSRERLGVAFTVRDPRQRVVWAAERRLNIVFNFAEALWYLAGSDDVEMIAYYAPSIRRFSMDGKRLTGTAYGPKIFRFGPNSVNQWDMVVQTLREDPESKRAVLQIFSPDEYLVPGNIDVSCTMALQFLIREGALHGVGFMRANDAFRGVVSDVFSFTFIQEVLATQLGLDVGAYHHNVGSYHVYDSDEAWAMEVAGAPGGRHESYRFPAMPVRDNWPDIAVVLELEAALRRNELKLAAHEIDDVAVDPYWRQVLCLFAVYREITTGGNVSLETLDYLLPVFRRFVANRWPKLPAL